MVVDRHLLFGLLALQVGLIDQDQLLNAFRAWARDKGRPLAEHLDARGDLDADGRAAVEAMVALHLKKHGGDAERSLAAVPAGRSTRERLAALDDPELNATVVRLGPGSSEPDADRTATYSVGSATSDGRRFRVLRPHARGGLGVVFVALDGELHREVALKQILDHHADDPASRQRFLLEAEITGGLEHPGIVPVYGLGTYADGRPYYAMRFIKGGSLKEAVTRFHTDEGLKGDLGRRSLELRGLLRRFLDVCNAVDYAQTRGVLHRDLKPGNIIVGKHGETLVVDWGLAKVTGRTDAGGPADEKTLAPLSAGGSSETLPGSAIGTPAYMSPEQAAGDMDRLGPRSDVYSLGATLYHLLTGKSPFEGGDVGSVLRAVRKGEYPPPRAVAPTIDRALESVCSKAMALDPPDRYASPRSLAEDVERWMADEPVSARREPLRERARRWVRRHRVAVASAAAALVMATIGLAGFLAREARSNRQLAGINRRLKVTNERLAAANAGEKRAKERERARYHLARKAIEAYYKGASEDVLLKRKEFEDLRKTLLKTALDFYRELTSALDAGREEDPSVLADLAGAYHDLGEVTGKVGSAADALQALQQALALYDQLERSRPGDVESRRQLAHIHRDVAALQELNGRPDQALRSCERALEILEELAKASPNEAGSRRDLALGEGRKSSLLLSLDRPADASKSLRKAVATLEGLVAANPGDLESLGALADTYGILARLQAQTYDGQFSADAFEHLRSAQRALEIREKLAAARPEDENVQYALLTSYNNIGVLFYRSGRWAEGLGLMKKAQRLLEKLVAAHPTRLLYQQSLVGQLNNIARTLRVVGHPAEALEASRDALRTAERLVAANPSVDGNRLDLARSHDEIGASYLALDRPAEALRSLESANRISEALFRDHPEEANYREALDKILGHLASTHRTLDRPDEAVAALLARRKLWPGDLTILYDVAGKLAQLSEDRAERGEHTVSTGAGLSRRREYANQAMATLDQAISAGFRDVRQLARDRRFDALRGRDDFRKLFGGDSNFPDMPFVGAHYVEPGTLEGESLAVKGKTANAARPQVMSPFGDWWSGGSQLWWSCSTPGGELSLILPVEAAGRYDLSAGFTTSFDYGIATLLLDGRQLREPLDLYGPAVVPTGSRSLDRISLAAGPHVLTVRMGAKNPKSMGYMFGLDWIKLTRVP